MANQERGVYQPQEDFAAYEDYPEEEGRSRLPLMIVIALVVLAAFGGVVWLAYNQGVAHGRAGAPPIIAAPAGPSRTQPDETQTASGQPGTPYTGLKIYGNPLPPDDEAAQSQVARSTDSDIVTVPPQPLVATSPQQTAQAEPQTRLPAPAAAPAHPTPAPAHATPQTAPSVETQVVHQQRSAPPAVATPETSPEPGVTIATQQPRTPAHAATLPTVHAGPPPATAHAPPRATPTAPPATSVATEPAPRMATATPEAHAQVATTTPAPAAAASPAHSNPSAMSGAAVLQIGSFTSASLASASWRAFQAKHASALAGLSDDVATAQIPGKGTWYRLRVGPFATRAAAASKCAELKAQGATCIVATP